MTKSPSGCGPSSADKVSRRRDKKAGLTPRTLLRLYSRSMARPAKLRIATSVL